MLTLDHIAVSAETLEQGVDFIEAALGVPMAGGGRHEIFGTHNKLLRLGDTYLEVIASDPMAGDLSYPRWFDLDRFHGPPRVSHWICRTRNAKASLQAALEGTGPMVEVCRGDLKWNITVPHSGRLPLDGCAPAIIDWGGKSSPAFSLPDLGCKLKSLKIKHPNAARLAPFLNSNLNDPRVILERSENAALEMQIETPTGLKCLK